MPEGKAYLVHQHLHAHAHACANARMHTSPSAQHENGDIILQKLKGGGYTLHSKQSTERSTAQDNFRLKSIGMTGPGAKGSESPPAGQWLPAAAAPAAGEQDPAQGWQVAPQIAAAVGCLLRLGTAADFPPVDCWPASQHKLSVDVSAWKHGCNHPCWEPEMLVREQQRLRAKGV